MLARVSSLLLLVLLFVVNAGAATKTDRERDGLKGRVKDVLTFAAQFSGPAGNCTQNKPTIQSRVRYNDGGNLLGFADYNYDGTLHRRDVFIYGGSGGVKEKASFDAAGFMFEKQMFDPNSAGRPVSDYMYQQGGSVNWTTTWQYDDKGNLIGTRTQDSSGNLIESQTFNPAGQVVEQEGYRDGALGDRRTYIYDEDGNRLEYSHYDAAGSLIEGPKDPARSLYRYDLTGHLLEAMDYGADGLLIWKHTYRYDENGSLAELSWYDREGIARSHRTYTYEYDSARNWISRKESEDFSPTCSHPMETLIRRITYY